MTPAAARQLFTTRQDFPEIADRQLSPHRNIIMKKKTNAGFTLIELLVVIAIIGILAAILIPAVGAVRASANNTKCVSNMRSIAQATLLYAKDVGRFPSNDAGPGENNLGV